MIQTKGLYEATRGCTACALRDGCKGPVPAKAGGRVMLVGRPQAGTRTRLGCHSQGRPGSI